MSINQDDLSARAKPSGFAMPVGMKGEGLHGSSYASFFVGFPRGGVGVGCVLVHSAFWESPMAVPGAHQEEFRFPVAYSITHRSHVNALDLKWRVRTGAAESRSAGLPGRQTILAKQELR